MGETLANYAVSSISVPSITDNTLISTSGWPNYQGTSGISGYPGINGISSVWEKLPILYTIKKVSAEGKQVCITYQEFENSPVVTTESGSVYIHGGIVGIFNKNDNHYWNNKLIIECESEEDVQKITVGKQFAILNQWDKKLGNDEIVKSLDNPRYYYNLVHSIIEESNPLTYNKAEQHRNIDTILKLKDYD